MLDIMVTFDEPETRTAPPLSPAVDSLKTESCMASLEPTLPDDRTPCCRQLHDARMQGFDAACVYSHPKAYKDPPLAAALLPVN